MLMAPGQRTDVLVQAGKPGTYAFRAVPYDQGYAAPTGPIARLVIEGDPLPMNLPTRLPPLPEKVIGDDEITGTRVLTFSQARVDIEGAEFWRTFRFMVDGKLSTPIGWISVFASAPWRNGRCDSAIVLRKSGNRYSG